MSRSWDRQHGWHQLEQRAVQRQPGREVKIMNKIQKTGVPAALLAQKPNTASSAAVGASVGAVLGAILFGPAGAFFGGAVGGGLGGAAGAEADERASRSKR